MLRPALLRCLFIAAALGLPSSCLAGPGEAPIHTADDQNPGAEDLAPSLPWESAKLLWGTPVFSKSLWPDEVTAARKNHALRRRALQMEETLESVQKSNVGGFQSRVFNSFHPHNAPELDDLQKHIIEAATQFFLMGLDASQTSDGGEKQREFLAGKLGALELFSIWVNINRAHDFNNAHVHSDCMISGAYYVSTGRPADDSESPASIVFNDPRSQPLSSFDYADWWGMSRGHAVEPQAGMVVLFPSWLMHRVEAVMPGETERISISFNIRLQAPMSQALASSHGDNRCVYRGDECIADG